LSKQPAGAGIVTWNVLLGTSWPNASASSWCSAVSGRSPPMHLTDLTSIVTAAIGVIITIASSTGINIGIAAIAAGISTTIAVVGTSIGTDTTSTGTSNAGLTVREIAKRYRISQAKVRLFIAKGELRAVNVATSLAGKPRWVVTRDSLVSFERLRAGGSPPSPPRRRRRQTLVDFFPDDD
jgi:hypothetical protein